MIRLIVLQQLFSSEHLQNYISKKIRQFSSHVQVTENITKALNSHETAQIINRRIEELFAEPESQFLDALGVKREHLEAIIRPAVLSLCAETAPFVLDSMHQSQFDKPKVVAKKKRKDNYILLWHCRPSVSLDFAKKWICT